MTQFPEATAVLEKTMNETFNETFSHTDLSFCIQNIAIKENSD